MKLFRSLTVLCLLFPVALLASSLMTQHQSTCRQSLDTKTTDIRELAGCKALLQAAAKGNVEGYYRFGQLLILDNNKSRIKRGLFYWVLAADEHHTPSINAISQYVKRKMVDGKIPLRFSHYVSYLEMDWKLKGSKKDHHYATYQVWLDQVEQAQLAPQKLAPNTLAAMATDFENGYFVGANPNLANKLFEMAANKGSALAQYKMGEMLYAKNQSKAIKYLQQAAKNNSSDAMLKLGEHFGCQGQKSTATQWFKRASQLENEYAEDEINALNENGKPTICQ